MTNAYSIGQTGMWQLIRQNLSRQTKNDKSIFTGKRFQFHAYRKKVLAATRTPDLKRSIK